jgi:hypothetical protein
MKNKEKNLRRELNERLNNSRYHVY